MCICVWQFTAMRICDQWMNIRGSPRGERRKMKPDARDSALLPFNIQRSRTSCHGTWPQTHNDHSRYFIAFYPTGDMSSEHSTETYGLRSTLQPVASSSTGHSSRASSRPTSRLSRRSPDSNEDIQKEDQDEDEEESVPGTHATNGHVCESYLGIPTLASFTPKNLILNKMSSVQRPGEWKRT